MPSSVLCPDLTPSRVLCPDLTPSRVLCPDLTPSRVLCPDLTPSRVLCPDLTPSRVLCPDLTPSRVLCPDRMPSSVLCPDLTPLEGPLPRPHALEGPLPRPHALRVLCPDLTPSRVLCPDLTPSRVLCCQMICYSSPSCSLDEDATVTYHFSAAAAVTHLPIRDAANRLGGVDFKVMMLPAIPEVKELAPPQSRHLLLPPRATLCDDSTAVQDEKPGGAVGAPGWPRSAEPVQQGDVETPKAESTHLPSQGLCGLEHDAGLNDSTEFAFPCRPRHSRATCADPSAKKCLVMDADDEAVLNLIAECEWDLSNPPGSTSSSQRGREANLPSSQESRHLLSPQSVQYQCGDSIKKGHEKRRSSSRGDGSEERPQNQYCGELPPQCGLHTHFAPHPDSTDIEESTLSQKSSLSAQKVLNPLPAPEKYRKRRMPGGRSQAPADQECLHCPERPSVPSSPEESLSRQSGSEGRSERTFPHSAVSEPEEERPPSVSGTGEVSPAKLYSAPPPGKKAGLEVVLLEALLDLVDRYWGGCKSLHGNEVFRAQARQILSSMQEFTAAQDISAAVSEEISFLTLEKRSLQKLLAEQQQQYSMRMSEVASELSNTRKEMGDLRQHLDKSLEENSSLKALLFSLKKEVKNADTAATLNLQITGLETSVKRLSGEIVGLKQHLEHYDKVWELTQMLQESHSSLVGTNEHLLQELSQARAQHKAEVEQLHWSYKELKKTLGLFPRGGC
ncbi:centrosomal protein of 72 kDa [Lynx canadensis]|nr:centrosomal protein of 72 kDa [Lynx canadensis]